MKIFVILCILVILACLYQSTMETFLTSYEPPLYSSNQMPCDYLAYTNPA